MFDYLRNMYRVTFGEELTMSDDEINSSLANHETAGKLWQDSSVNKDMILMTNMSQILEYLYNIQKSNMPISLVSELPSYTTRAKGHKFEFTQPTNGSWALLVDDVGAVSSNNVLDLFTYIQTMYNVTAMDMLFDCYLFVFAESLQFSKDEVFLILSKAKVYGDVFNDKVPQVEQDLYTVKMISDLATYLRGFVRYKDKIMRAVTGEVL